MIFEIIYLLTLLAASCCLVGTIHAMGIIFPIGVQIALGWFLMWIGVDLLFICPVWWRKTTPLAVVMDMLSAIERRIYSVECILIGLSHLERRMVRIEGKMKVLKRSNSWDNIYNPTDNREKCGLNTNTSSRRKPSSEENLVA